MSVQQVLLYAYHRKTLPTGKPASRVLAQHEAKIAVRLKEAAREPATPRRKSATSSRNAISASQ